MKKGNRPGFGVVGHPMTTFQKLGPSGLDVFPLVLGGNVFGWTSDETESFAVLDAYAAAGGNLIDTADAYSAWVPGHTGGESETILGRWIASRANRDAVLVATKVGAHPEFKGLRAGTIKAGAEASLRRLGTDHIDLYYTHFDDESVPVEEIVTALDQLVQEGKVRHLAASNISPARLRAALEFARSAGLASYAALQPHYNLISRDTYEGELAEVVAEYGLAAVPYSALASGFLTGKYRRGGPVIDGPRAKASTYLDTPRGPKVLEALDAIAADRDADVATIALAWLAAQPTVTAPIASARTPDQLPALLAVADLQLTDGEVQSLTAASA
jgi:aryl-alcohol dehydrogenase-like predicted oxidoreductase